MAVEAVRILRATVRLGRKGDVNGSLTQLEVGMRKSCQGKEGLNT